MSQQFEIPPPQLAPGQSTKPVPLSRMQPNLSDDELIRLEGALKSSTPAFVTKASDVKSVNVPTGTAPVSVFPEVKKEESVPDEEKAEEKPEIDEAELNIFWNSVLAKKPYTKTFVIKGLKVTMQTRTNDEIEKSLLYLDRFNDSLISTYEYMHAKVLAAAALLRIGDDYLGSGSLEQRIEYINSLSQVSLSLIMKCLEKFDASVTSMEDHIYSENF